MTTETETKPQLPAAAPPGSGAQDPVARFRRLPAEEKWLAGAAVAVLVGFLISNSWHKVFGGGWFETCALIGAGLVLVLTVLDLFAVKLVEKGVRTWALALTACLPAAGWLFDLLSDFWTALIFAGSVALAWWAWQLLARE